MVVRPIRSHRLLQTLVLAAVAGLSGCPGEVPDGPGTGAPGSGSQRPTVAYVTNGIASFWVIAEKGAQDAGKEFDAQVEVRMPPEGPTDQKRMIEELLAMGVDGIAVSPIDPDNQRDILNACGEQTHYITHDSDAPDTNRLCYVGMSNYDAGRLCGELIREAMPAGGSIMIFVGRLEQANARLRRQGLIDELLERSPDPDRTPDPADVVLKHNDFEILGTRTDQFNFSAAKALAEDALAAHPDLDCMVGLFAYNPPYILEALKGAGKLGDVKVIGFDEQDETLQAIIDGHCFGTVVQDPYRYGYESVRILAGLARDDQSVLPSGGFLDIPARKITRSNVDEFWKELRRLTGQTPQDDSTGADDPDAES